VSVRTACDPLQRGAGRYFALPLPRLSASNGLDLRIAAFFAKGQVTIAEGSSTRFRRGSGSGFDITFHFCGVCGSTIWWEPERLPSMIGVAVANPDFPAPMQAVWDKRQHRWLHLPDEIVSYPESPVRTGSRE
jgi:hypothetical protein